MATFDNVTYTYYSTTLGRDVVPDDATFNMYKLENIQYVKQLMTEIRITERDPNGIDDAVCMMIEADYKTEKLMNGEDSKSIASESVAGHSVSFASNAVNTQISLDAESTKNKKIKLLKMFCDCDFSARVR